MIAHTSRLRWSWEKEVVAVAVREGISWGLETKREIGGKPRGNPSSFMDSIARPINSQVL